MFKILNGVITEFIKGILTLETKYRTKKIEKSKVYIPSMNTVSNGTKSAICLGPKVWTRTQWRALGNSEKQ